MIRTKYKKNMNKITKDLIQDITKVYNNSLINIIDEYLTENISIQYDNSDRKYNNIREETKLEEINIKKIINNCIDEYTFSDGQIKFIIKYVLDFQVIFFNEKLNPVPISLREILLIFNDMEIFISGSFLLCVIRMCGKRKDHTYFDYGDIDLFIFGNIDAREIIQRITDYLPKNTIIQRKIINSNGIIYDNLDEYILTYDNTRHEFTKISLFEELSKYKLQNYELHPGRNKVNESTAGDLPQKENKEYPMPFNNLLYIGCRKYRKCGETRYEGDPIRLNIIQIKDKDYKTYFHGFDFDFCKNYISINKFVIISPESVLKKKSYQFSTSTSYTKEDRRKKYHKRDFTISGYKYYDKLQMFTQDILEIPHQKYNIKKIVNNFDQAILYCTNCINNEDWDYSDFYDLLKKLPKFIYDQLIKTCHYKLDLNIMGQLFAIKHIMLKYKTVN